jgi:hypothetical protein
MIDEKAMLTMKHMRHTLHPGERVFRELAVNVVHDCQLILMRRSANVVQAAAAYIEQPALTPNAKMSIVLFQHRYSSSMSN